MRNSLFLLAAILVAASAARAQNAPQKPTTSVTEAHVLPPLPAKFPAWLFSRDQNQLFRRRGIYNDAVYNVRPLALDLNAVAVGHAFAYEDLVTGKSKTLETATYERINRVLNHPPRFMPDEDTLAPTFARKYGVLEQVFGWTHVLHAQTIDVLASTQLSRAQKDAEIQRLWDFYFHAVPYAITPLPMNMGWLDNQPYSGAFRRKYPKVNGLFWGYHWLQGAMYDGLDGLSLEQQKRSYETIGRRYHEVELRRTDRDFMPMFAENSPKFAAKFPKIANAFDNLHMLHDMVNDILSSDWITEKQKSEQITRAIYLLSASAHQNEKPGDFNTQNGLFNTQNGLFNTQNGLHDHRFMDGMAGMGLMRGSDDHIMPMAGQGWMNLSECHHCSMGLPQGEEAWRAATVSAQGWTMRVRCALCARDMSAQTKGEAILRIPLETPDQTLVVFSGDDGTLSTQTPGVVFLEEAGNHAKCNAWSRAFSGRAAFEAYVRENPKYAGAQPLSFEAWSQIESVGEPNSYEKIEPPAGFTAPMSHAAHHAGMEAAE